jgi:hypothetical protein
MLICPQKVREMSNERVHESEDDKPFDVNGPAPSEELRAKIAEEQQMYWRREDEFVFCLLIDDKPRAYVNVAQNVAFLGQDENAPCMVVPDSESVFDAVESHLGIGTVQDVLRLDGKLSAKARYRYEDDVTQFRRSWPAAREPQHYLQRASKYLTRALTDKTLSDEGGRARLLIRQALREFEINDRWTPEARAYCRRAAELMQNPRDLSYEETSAAVNCEKAFASLEHGRAKEAEPTERESRERDTPDRAR